MIERFLRYSIERARKIKIVFEDGAGVLRHRNITVLSVDSERLFYLSSGRKLPQDMPLSSVLAASYARGDEGDPLKNELSSENA